LVGDVPAFLNLVGRLLPAWVVVLEYLFSLGECESSRLFLFFHLGLAGLILLFLLESSVGFLAFALNLNFSCLNNYDGHGSCDNGCNLNFVDLCSLSHAEGFQDASAW